MKVLYSLFFHTEDVRFYDGEVNRHLHIDYPWPRGLWTVTFKPEKKEKTETLIRDSVQTWDNNLLSGRIQTTDYGFEIFHIEYADSGTFEFRDPQGNLALTALLNVCE